MSIGAAIRIIESIVTIYCGVILAVRPYKMRWNNIPVKITFWALVVAGMTVECVNSLWFKFSSIITIALAVYLFAVLLIFYRIFFLQLLIRNFFYWYLIILCRFWVICLCCMTSSVAFRQYIIEEYGEPWHWIHIAGMLATMGMVLFFVHKIKDRSFIAHCSKKDYFWMILLLLCEEIINEVIFNERNLSGLMSGNYLISSGLVLWSLVSGIIIFYIYRLYMISNKKEQMSEMNLKMLQGQYTLLQEMFEQKRMQIHDSVHHDMLVMEYLRGGQSEKALKYLERKIDKARLQGKNKYTGVDVIDLMLNYKMEEAKKYDIKVHMNLDVFFCPMEDMEMCIVLGNLLDNAIEAVAGLPPEQRWIRIFMKTPNQIFLLEIKNPYEGRRKKEAGHYITTKPDRSQHGLGLDSVERIIGKYHSELEIMDDGKEFLVMVNI